MQNNVKIPKQYCCRDAFDGHLLHLVLLISQLIYLSKLHPSS